jgi:hypothetical protein
MMLATKNSGGVLSLRAADSFSTVFQQIFTTFCVLLAEICISLFFHVSASKLYTLLITDNDVNTNRIQREFLFNNAIASQKALLASNQKPPNSNLLKPWRLRNFVVRALPPSFSMQWGKGLGDRGWVLVQFP